VTRINLIPPADLTDQHLLAEYRELPRCLPLAAAALARGDLDGPPAFTLGAGHVRFFFTRTHWLCARHAALTAELLARGVNLTPREPLVRLPTPDLEWKPSAADVALSLDRLRERLSERPGWYRYGGAVVGADFYGETMRRAA
jgi:hypothetical protein